MDLDLDLFTLQDLRELLASVKDALRIVFKQVARLPREQVPVNYLLLIEDHQRTIEKIKVEIELRQEGGKAATEAATIKILFLSANTLPEAPLAIDREIRGIQDRLRASKYGNRFELVQEFAVRTTDVPQHLLYHEPGIVHLGGHGDNGGHVLLEGHDGRAQAVSLEGFAFLFGQFKEHLRCVVLNACYSQAQAQMMSAEIACVVGMGETIYDDAAIGFSEGFYSALGHGKSVRSAFDIGRAAGELVRTGQAEVPRLYTAQGVRAEDVVFASRSGVAA